MKDLQPSDFIAIIALLTSFASVFLPKNLKTLLKKRTTSISTLIKKQYTMHFMS